MLEYVKCCKSKYVKGKEVEYIKCVLSGVIDEKHEEKVVRRATKALLQRSDEQGRGCFITRRDILSRAGFKCYRGPSSGLWPWLEDNADVVEKAKGRRAYRIREEFYPAMVKLRPNIERGL